MANEAVTYACEMGLASVYTDHSLFGFDDIASIILNRVSKSTLPTVGAAICVSHTCCDNFILRAHMLPSIVHVIPNAVHTSKFIPDLSITVVVVSRLVYRNDGNKKLSSEEMVERERLHDRVEFLGYVPHSSVRDVLVRGNVFLNCSLAESFCIAILEAASAGLFVVSTNVGGVPEVLPPEMIHHADPNVDSLVESLSCAISGKSFQPIRLSFIADQMYSWQRIAGETVTVYDRVIARPRLSLSQRLVRYKTVRHLAGFVVWYACWALHCISLFSLWNCGNHGI
ncbi:LOW QUALITY PROTEIN: hypothetical protein HJC23_000103 [Cyclotella cryptica]|uniref:Glycosyltransferase n=1 Tax=Cyclotella cryptica TaxID=29204 RepID=A0ABD3P7A8_9STRA